MQRLVKPVISAFFLMMLVISVNAATIVVRQDGSGDFATIGAAVEVAEPGDLILVGLGNYAEELLITKSLDIVAEADGEYQTVLDGENVRGIMIIDGVHSVNINGFTFARAYVPGGHHGSALLAWNGPTVHIENCLFVDNVAGWDNGAVHARHSGTSVTLSGCRFERNFAYHNGGACGVHSGASMYIYNSIFIENSTDGIAGACNAYGGANLVISGSLFVNNSDHVGAVRIYHSSATITNCTFHDNASSLYATVKFVSAISSIFSNNIVTSDTGGAGIDLSGSITHTCNIYYGNDAGSIIGGSLSPCELEDDPQFCDYTVSDFTLCVTSPAAPEDNPCGLIGAYGVGCDSCGPVAVESISWSEVKKLYR